MPQFNTNVDQAILKKFRSVLKANTGLKKGDFTKSLEAAMLDYIIKNSTSHHAAHYKIEKNPGLKITDCETILALDKSIRFVGICTAAGKLLVSIYRKGLSPLLNKQELEFAASESATKALDRKTKANKLGKVVYSVTAYEDVKRATFSMADNLYLLVSYERNVDDTMIQNKILPEITMDSLQVDTE